MKVVMQQRAGKTTPPGAPYHYNNTANPLTRGRAFEGWYTKVVTPEKSFAIIHCIEDPRSDGSKLSKCSSQVVWDEFAGGNNGATANRRESQLQKGVGGVGYLMQHTRNTKTCFASDSTMLFGANYNDTTTSQKNIDDISASDQAAFFNAVQQGFQCSDTLHMGSLVATDADGDMNSLYTELATKNTASKVRWAYTMTPLYGYGDSAVEEPTAAAQGDPAALQDTKPVEEQTEQKATTSLLTSSPLLDPQWQICVAHALATGWIELDGGERYYFENAPAYVEKNWSGLGGFPEKWWWLECNTFTGIKYADLSLTAVGARRRTWQPVGGFVEMCLVAVHFGGRFFEFAPWNGAKMEWSVSDWGQWKMCGSNSTHVIEITASTKDAGVYIRGPHSEHGFIPLCRDSFQGTLSLKVWEKPTLLQRLVNPFTNTDADDDHNNNSTTSGSSIEHSGTLVIDAHSTTAAVEVGGGPEVWKKESVWESKCTIPKLVMDTLKEPVDVNKIVSSVFGTGG